MTTEQYQIGYEEGYQEGWNAAMEGSVPSSGLGKWYWLPMDEIQRAVMNESPIQKPLELSAGGAQALSAACGYFSFSDECGFDRHDTAEAAKAAATEMLADIRRELCGEEWPMEVESICWGAVVERAAEHGATTGEDGEKYCDYVLKGVSPTPPAEQQVEVRKQDTELIQQMLEALESLEGTGSAIKWQGQQELIYPAITAARKRLENT